MSTKSGSPKFILRPNICFNASTNRCKPNIPFASPSVPLDGAGIPKILNPIVFTSSASVTLTS
ncbi:hypothetical protein HanXRQr2_Chr03g0087771 [Helianthus annuus]|uniref:Uncharacterized protein n=1 Tax=Helianthus annuus TaxID=4232 RepID=A0A9K3NV41_HELAN|nr:hypothetical protein HanXRQr2_Chr03g0087771 [Helianthus annuus]